jgi:hypothetical protein
MTYAELAEFIGTSLEAAKRRAARGKWSRRLHNDDGRARVLVPPDVLPNEPPSPTPSTSTVGGNVTPHQIEAIAALSAALDAARETASEKDKELARLREALRTAEIEAAEGRGEMRRLDETVQALRGELERLHEAHRLALARPPSFWAAVGDRLRALLTPTARQ